SEPPDNAVDNGTVPDPLTTTKTATKASVVAKSASRAKGNTTMKETQAIELYQPTPLPSTRPIAATTLDIVQHGTIPGNRPVSVAHLTVVDNQSLPNHRPIVKSGLSVVSTDTLPGHRPVVRSKFPLPGSDLLPNHRPIASNAIDDPRELMGFLD
ncbi:MAG: hypothetical protein WCD18_24480, partial [Thermosynechococcaceae cyanobacterium]